MPHVTFVEADGTSRKVSAPAGLSLMEAARSNGIAGIVALCGGAGACATCHIYVDPAWQGRLDAPEDIELGMLESAWEPRDTSRLSCQIRLSAELEGLLVVVPRQQAGG